MTDLVSEDDDDEGSESLLSSEQHHHDDAESIVSSQHDHDHESEDGSERDSQHEYLDAVHALQQELMGGDEHTPVASEKKGLPFDGPTDTDSGLGSEVPTTAGALSGSETDYFRRVAEDAASSLAGV